MNIEKKKKNLVEKLNSAEKGEVINIMTLKPKHFKKNLSTDYGVGIQDLKKTPKEFIKWLITEDIDFRIMPTILSEKDYKIKLITVKDF